MSVLDEKWVYSRHDHLSNYWDITPEDDEFFIVATANYEEYAKHITTLHNASLPAEPEDPHCVRQKCMTPQACSVLGGCSSR